MATKKSKAMKFLEKLTGGPVTVGEILETYRMNEEIPQAQFAKILGISRSHLCDIEKGRRRISPDRAAHFAKLIGRNPQQLIRLSLQEMLNDSGLKYKVEVTAA